MTTIPTLRQLIADRTLLTMVPRTEDRSFLRFWTRTVALPNKYYIEVDGRRLFEYEVTDTRFVPSPATMRWRGTCAPVDDLDDQYEIVTQQAFPDHRHQIVGLDRIQEPTP